MQPAMQTIVGTLTRKFECSNVGMLGGAQGLQFRRRGGSVRSAPHLNSRHWTKTVSEQKLLLGVLIILVL